MRRTILLLSAAALVLSACGNAKENEHAAGSATPSPSAGATAATASASASSTLEISLDYEIPPFDEMAAMFDYDTSEPLGYEVTDERREDEATVYDVTYRSSGYAVPAWLVIPDGRGPFPVVLYAHGSGGGRGWFLEDALALAREGSRASLRRPTTTCGRSSSDCCGKRAAEPVPAPRESVASNAAAGVVPSVRVFVRI